MVVGVPKEIKDNEKRVSLTPFGVSELVKNGHSVLVETQAGVGSGFYDDKYIHSGAKIINSPEEIDQIINNVTMEHLKLMSNECKTWYLNNCSLSGSYKNLVLLLENTNNINIDESNIEEINIDEPNIDIANEISIVNEIATINKNELHILY